jgi:rubredoxin
MGSWKCGNCGYELQADRPPEKCPSCKEKCDFLDNTCYTPDCQYEGKDTQNHGATAGIRGHQGSRKWLKRSLCMPHARARLKK